MPFPRPHPCGEAKVKTACLMPSGRSTVHADIQGSKPAIICRRFEAKNWTRWRFACSSPQRGGLVKSCYGKSNPSSQIENLGVLTDRRRDLSRESARYIREPRATQGCGASAALNLASRISQVLDLQLRACPTVPVVRPEPARDVDGGAGRHQSLAEGSVAGPPGDRLQPGRPLDRRDRTASGRP